MADGAANQASLIAEEATAFLQRVADIKYSLAVSELGGSTLYQEVFEVDLIYDEDGSSFMPYLKATSANLFRLLGR